MGWIEPGECQFRDKRSFISSGFIPLTLLVRELRQLHSAKTLEVYAHIKLTCAVNYENSGAPSSKGCFPLGDSLRAERNSSLSWAQSSETIMENTKENSAPRGKFRLVENSLNVFDDKLCEKKMFPGHIFFDKKSCAAVRCAIFQNYFFCDIQYKHSS